MMQTMDCGEARVSLGAYVLGSIDPAERAMVDAHLSACRDCRDELAGLAGLPALMSRVSLDEVLAMSEDGLGEEARPWDAPATAATAQAGERAAQERQSAPGAEPPVPGAEPPRELLGTVLDLTAARRSRRTWRIAGLSVAAAVIIAAGAFGGARLATGNSPAGAPSAAQGLDYGSPLSGWMTVHGSTDGMAATVMYREMGWGTQLAAKVVGIPIGTPCQLLTIGTNGTRTVVGGWTTDNVEGTIWYPASAQVPATQIREYQVTVSGHQPITIPT